MDLIKEKRIVPVVKIDRVEDALPLAKALIDGGLPVAEITFRTDAAEESIRVIRENYPQMLCGAGTVVNIDQAERAVAAGAAFIVSPGFNKDVVEYALRKNIPVLPGRCTPTEIMEALGHGPQYCQVFPGQTVRRPGHDKSSGRSVSGHQVYAYRRDKHREFKGISE